MWGSSLKQLSSSAQRGSRPQIRRTRTRIRTSSTSVLMHSHEYSYMLCVLITKCAREQRSTDHNGQCGRDAALAALEGGDDRGPHSRRR